jgi:flagellar hook-length control protein FliK
LATQIVSGARLMVKDGMTKIQIQLEPAELGKLELSLVVERDLVAARFVTETQGVQSLIEANLPQLRSALEEMGLQVDLLQVGVQAEGDSQMANQNMTGGEQFQRNTGSKPLAEMFVAEEQIFGEEAWHGMVNLRI